MISRRGSLAKWFLPLLLVAGRAAFAVGQTPENLPAANECACLAACPCDGADPTCPCAPDGRVPFNDPPADRQFRMVWGIVDVAGDYGQRTAPNGAVYHPIYTMDMDFNIWLWPAAGFYAYENSTFWMGTTSEGLNFTKRELDFEGGLAWNYYGWLEGRIFGYSDANMNRGNSAVEPSGYSDGFGVENRLYLNDVYSALGTSDFDQALATFVSIGYYPTKVMIGADGKQFFPSVFARAYLTYDLAKDHCCYAFADVLFLTKKSFTAKLVDTDAGIAVRPFSHVPRFELRAGCLDVWDVEVNNARPVGYLSIRYIF
jgi:hypothetical protein